MHRAPSVLLLLLALVACARTAPATQCQSSAQCPEGSRCDSGVCTADRRPVAAVAPIGAVEAYALVQLDATASHDPDPDDGVADHEWTVRAVDAPCAPPEITSRDPRPFVRFGCAGRYRVGLVVRDRLGLEGDPATADVEVAAPTGAPLVVAGPDVATDHACRGTPLACRTTTRVSLSAAARPGLALRWTVLPPAGRPLDAHRRVTFLPGPDAVAPEAVLETDGTAISGDWVFRAEVLDAYGVLGAAHTRVSVRNRAPVVTLAPAGAFPHRFDPGRGVFEAAGALAWSVVDPDGDPVEVSGVWRHVGDGDGATFDGDFDGTQVRFALEVPYAAPEDALHLIGGADLARTIELVALDANRTEGLGAAEIRIGNRPPVPAGGTVDTAVPHRFDRERSLYVATARAGTWTDPDGDPLFGAPGDAPCDTLAWEGSDATVICTAPYAGVPAVERLAGTRSFPVRVRDPWAVAATVPLQTVEILNAPPALTTATPSPDEVCGQGSWQFSDPICPAHLTVPAVAFDVAPTFSDPDGDPMLVTVSTRAGSTASPAGALLAAPATVPFHFTQPSYLIGVCAYVYQATRISVTDGAASVTQGVSPYPHTCN